MRLRVSLLLSIAGIFVLGIFTSPHAQAQGNPEQELAEKYAPILMLKQQTAPCDYAGEGYIPTTVDWLWNNPDVALRVAGDGDAEDDALLKQGPSAQDLSTAGPDTYLDFPGDPRNPGCTYEQYFKQRVADLGLQPTIYAKYVYSPTEHRLYLEYWYYFFFNDWNDTHESDWEMLALGFNAESAEQALTMQPAWIGYAQHGGGESAHWDDAKFQKDGDHPIAYLSAGSHATYYSSETMIGWGENGSAFGCDVTTGPSTAVHPQVTVIPDRIDANGPFAWALFQGRWGQRESSVFNGPTGPNMGKKWNDPAAAFGDWRTSTLTVPSSNAVGINTTDLFCTLSEKGSRALVRFGAQPWLVGAAVLGILGLAGLAVWRIWPFFTESLDVYGHEIRTFLGIGALAVPIGLLFNGFQIWASDVPPLSWLQQSFDGSNSGKLAATLFVAVFQQLAMLLVIAPAVIFALGEIREGIKPGVVRSYLGGFRHIVNLAIALAIVGIGVLLLAWTILLIPVAIYVLVRLQFFSQAVILDDMRDWRASLRQSWRVTRGRWFWTFLVTVAFQLLGSLPGPLIGVLMMIVGGANVRFANAVSSFVYAIFVPLAVIGITLAYRRLKGDPVIEPHILTRERDPAKAAKMREMEEDALRRTGETLPG